MKSMRHRSGCSNAPAQPCQGRDGCHVVLWGFRACSVVLAVLSNLGKAISACPGPNRSLLSMNKYVADNFWFAKLPLSYAFGLHPKDTTLPVQKWNLGDCFKCWRLPPLTYFLLYQSHSWLDRKARWLAPSHPVCFCTSLLCGAGSCSYSFFMTLPHYTLSNCSLFLWPWSPPGQSIRSGTVFLSYLLERLETWGYFSAKKFVCMCTLLLVGFLLFYHVRFGSVL